MEGKIVDADDLIGICEDCLFDIEIQEISGQIKKLELKSYKEETIGNIAYSSRFKNQFKAYLAAADNLDEFEYIFNYRKTTNLDLIKMNFKTLFSNEASILYSDLGQSKFLQLFGVDNVNDFLDDIVPIFNGPLYNFIKIE